MPVQIGADASGFSTPIRLLSECHRRIEMFLNALHVAAGFYGRPLREDERHSLAMALRYFREAAPKHNADEEESLFPRLQSASPAADEVIQQFSRLEQEHRRATPLHEETDRLGKQWLAQGNLSQPDAESFRAAVVQLVSIYSEHIAFEDKKVFPLADRCLSATQMSEIAAEMAQRRNAENE